MPPRKSLQAFLATARSALTAPPSKRPSPLTFVVGNESADLDSLCSALLLAYFRSQAPPHYALHIPLCNIPRDDLALRPEFRAALHDASLTPDDVLTLSELPAPDALKPSDARFLLVDHNVLTGPLARIYGTSEIVGCVDHHDDEGKVPRDADPRVVEKCGSCMSLVVEHFRDIWDGLEKEKEKGVGEDTDNKKDVHLAHLVLAPILIDTRNLGDATKTTARDERIVKYAEAKLGGAGDKGYDRTALFERLDKLKSDIEPLSLRDILRKDYKEWDEGEENAGETTQKKKSLKLGTSSVPRSISFLVQKAGSEAKLVDALAGWGEEREVDLVVVLTSFSPAADEGKDGTTTTTTSDDHARELLVWARTGAQAVDAAQRFADANSEALRLRTWGDGKLDVGHGDDWRRCWTQGKLEYSRKQVAPMLREAMSRN